MNRNTKRDVIVICLTVLSYFVFVSCGGGESYSMDDPRDKTLIEQMLKNDIDETETSNANNTHYQSDRQMALELQANYKNGDNISGQSDGGNKVSDFNSANYTTDGSFPFNFGDNEFVTNYPFKLFGIRMQNNRPAADNARLLNSGAGSGQRNTQNSGNLAGTGVDGHNAADSAGFQQGYVQQMTQSDGLMDNIAGGVRKVQELRRISNSENLIGMMAAAYPRASQLLSSIFQRCPEGDCRIGNPTDLGGLVATLTQVLEDMSPLDEAGRGAAGGRNPTDIRGLAALLQQVMEIVVYGLGGTAASKSLPEMAGLSDILLQLLGGGGNREAANTAVLPQLLDLIMQIIQNAPPAAGPAGGSPDGAHPPSPGLPEANSG